MKSKKKDKLEEWREPIKVNKSIPSYEDDPFFVKKREEAIKSLENTVFPPEILRRIQKD